MMRLLVVTLSAVGLAFATAAQAQTAAPFSEDARCALEMVVLSNSTDPDAQHFGQGGVTYFVGRLSVREPNFDFQRLKTLGATLDPKSVESDLQQRCSPIFQASMRKLESALAPPPGAAGAAPTAPKAPAPH
jgi:hypothetical protein